jgi:F-type H+-transporting ATPase subunit b
MLRLFEERERRIEGAKNEAREMYKEADAKIARYEEELVGVKRAAGEERDKLRAEGQRREQAILGKVRAETNVLLEEGKARIAKDAEGLRKELDATSQQLAREIASRVLGREVS